MNAKQAHRIRLSSRCVSDSLVPPSFEKNRITIIPVRRLVVRCKVIIVSKIWGHWNSWIIDVRSEIEDRHENL